MWACKTYIIYYSTSFIITSDEIKIFQDEGANESVPFFCFWDSMEQLLRIPLQQVQVLGNSFLISPFLPLYVNKSKRFWLAGGMNDYNVL